MTQLLSRATIGTLLWVVVATQAQRRPPNYSQDKMPVTSFSCRDKIIGGYYADTETDCQMFHVCVKVPGQGIQDYKFLCPNETAFDQENQICDDWFNIDCEAGTLYYSDNFDLYRIGSDFPGSSQHLPSNSINNAVSENDDEYYLQKSDRGESVSSDLLRGSHSSNFFANKNRGREDDEDVKDDYKKKTTPSKGNVRKLLTGKRPIASTQAPVENYQSTAQYQPRTRDNNYSGRVSQFRGHVRNQQTPSTEATAAPSRQTEAYNRQPFQRNYYSPTTPKIETTPATQRTEYFRNYNPTTKQNFYDNTQNYNAQTTVFAQTTRNYYTPRVTSTTPQPTPYVETTTANNAERNNYFETQRLYQINTAALNQYEEPKDEFLKTAPSQNLGASAFNSLQNSYKSFNTNVSASYNFNPTQATTTVNYQTQSYFPQSTVTPNYYSQTTLKPFQQQNYYTTPKAQPTQQNYYTTAKAQPTQQNYKQDYYTPSAQTSTVRNVPQYSSTTIKPFQQSYSQPAQTTFQQYNPTTLRPQYQQQFTLSTPKPFSQPQQYNQNYQSATAAQTTGFQSQRNPAAQQNYQAAQQQPQRQSAQQFQSQKSQVSKEAPAQKNQVAQQYQQQRNPSQYYSPTTQKSYQAAQTTFKVADTTQKPRPFTQVAGKEEKKEKDQYDYAYYDDAAQTEYDNIEPLEEFKRTKSRNQ